MHGVLPDRRRAQLPRVWGGVLRGRLLPPADPCRDGRRRRERGHLRGHLTLYGVELLRENWCITHLDIDPSFPDLHLAEVASESVQHRLLAWNNRYWKAALASMVLVVANIVVSVLYLAANYRGLGGHLHGLLLDLVLMKL